MVVSIVRFLQYESQIDTFSPQFDTNRMNESKGAMYRCWIARIVLESHESRFSAVLCDSCAAGAIQKSWSRFPEARSQRHRGRCTETALRKLVVGWLVLNFRGRESKVCDWGSWRDREVRCDWLGLGVGRKQILIWRVMDFGPNKIKTYA